MWTNQSAVRDPWGWFDPSAARLLPADGCVQFELQSVELDHASKAIHRGGSETGTGSDRQAQCRCGGGAAEAGEEADCRAPYNTKSSKKLLTLPAEIREEVKVAVRFTAKSTIQRFLQRKFAKTLTAVSGRERGYVFNETRAGSGSWMDR